MRAGTVVVLTVLAGWPTGPARADQPAVVSAERVVSPDLFMDVRSEFQAGRDHAITAAWVWSVVVVGSASYAIWSSTKEAHPVPVAQYGSYIGVLGGAVGLVQAMARAGHAGDLMAGLDRDQAANPSPIRLSPPTVQATDRELRGTQATLAARASGTLRAGCVVPMLLGGIGLYGLALRNPSGDDLAGLAIGGAVVVGGPSVLTYWGLKYRLERIDQLIQRWDEADPRHSPAAR